MEEEGSHVSVLSCLDVTMVRTRVQHSPSWYSLMLLRLQMSAALIKSFDSIPNVLTFLYSVFLKGDENTRQECQNVR